MWQIPQLGFPSASVCKISVNSVILPGSEVLVFLESVLLPLEGEDTTCDAALAISLPLSLFGVLCVEDCPSNFILFAGEDEEWGSRRRMSIRGGMIRRMRREG